MRRALVLFGNEIERGSLAESAAFLENEWMGTIYWMERPFEKRVWI